MTESQTIEKNQESQAGFALAVPGIRIAPSLLAADFSRLERDVTVIESAGAQVLHLDVMDGHFAPNISFGAPVIASLRPHSKMFFDAHLMIAEPARYAEAFVEAGCDHITFHIETVDKPTDVIERIRSLGASVGVSLNPDTPVTDIEPILDQIDIVLIMSVWPGFGGQKFIDHVLSKAEYLRDRLGSHQRLEIDGGIGPGTIASAASAGVDTFVAGTAVFRAADPADALATLQKMAEDAFKGSEG